MKERTLQCPGAGGPHRLHYYDWGDSDNPHVALCVHGLTRNGRDFDWLAQKLSARCRVICPDVAGRGKSEWLANKEDYNYPTYVADMSALIASLGVEQVDWVGTSMGGLIGMLMAALPNPPIRRLVVNDVGPFIPKVALERIGFYVGKDPRFRNLKEVETILRLICSPFGPLTDDQWRHLAEHSSRLAEDGSRMLCYDPGIAWPFRQAMQDVDLWSVWDTVRCATLILRGLDSDLLLAQTAHDMTQRGPRAKLVEFAGVGHAPMLMDEVQIRTVEDFLLAR